MSVVVVIGAGVGGLSAAIALTQAGKRVTVLEATDRLGGLAGPLDIAGHRFDGGPYILLDPTGLTHAFTALGLSVEALELVRVDDVYEVERDDGPPIRIRASLDETVDGLERVSAGQGVAYRRFVEEMTVVHRALEPLQRSSRPSPWKLVKAGALRHAPFLLRSLNGIFARAGFSPAVRDAVGIWTHVAGQSLAAAPSPLALVPAMIHGPGCFVPRKGVAAIVEAVVERARALGITLQLNAPVRRIVVDAGVATGVELVDGTRVPARQVVSNASGVATLVKLLDVPTPNTERARALPLQSPGVAAYGLGAPVGADEPYLRFHVNPAHVSAPCRLLVRPQRVIGGAPLVRIVAPLAHDVVEPLDEAAQERLLDEVVAEPWVRARVGSFQPLARLVPKSWGRRATLYRDSMNPVMTAQFMRQGRLPHRLDVPKGLFLVGSSTHPGQWVSFCLISGVLGADALLASGA